MNQPLNENPQVAADRVKQEVERWIDVARTAGERTLEAIGLSPMGKAAQPAVDLWETPEAVFVWIDLPGVSFDSVNLATTANQVTVKVQRDSTGGYENGRYHLRERMHLGWERTLTLPTTVSPDQAAAQLRDGVLRITLPEQPIAEPRSVPIHVAS